MRQILQSALLLALGILVCLAGCPPHPGSDASRGALAGDAGPDPSDAGPDAGELPVDTAAIDSLVLLSADIVLRSTAVGRATDDGTAPTLALTSSGYTHPSVIYVPEGWNGFAYWMAISPYFGVVGHDDQYENPHVFRSADGIDWEEPPGISNPIDHPPAAPSMDYWSDPHLLLGPGGALYCFYRGAGIDLGGRSLYFETSTDGARWSAHQLVYSTASLESVDYTNKLLSPVVIPDGERWDVFDVVRSSPTGLVIPEQKNQTGTFVMRRSSPSIASGYPEYDASQVVTFANRPWGLEQDPWHLDVRFFGGRWFMLLNTGALEDTAGDALWLAVSADGSTFHVVGTPVFEDGTYRSALVPIAGERSWVDFLVYRAEAEDGTIDVYRMHVSF